MEDFTCSICLQPLRDPVRLCTGHVYDRHCIETWFSSRPPPHTCPLSNVVLPSLELMPASDVRARALLWAAAEQPEAVVEFEQPAPPPVVLTGATTTSWGAPSPPPVVFTGDTTTSWGTPPPPRLTWRWALPWVVARVVVLFVTLSRAGTSPLVNLGSTYSTQIWRCVTSLFTDTNPVVAVANSIFQFSFVTNLMRSGVSCAPVLLSAAMGAFFAGVALPHTPFACGTTLSCVFSIAGLCAARNVGDHKWTWLACFGLVITTVLGLFRGNEMVSHVAAGVTYLLVRAVAVQEHCKPAMAAYVIAVTGTVTAFGTDASMRGLAFLAPQF